MTRIRMSPSIRDSPTFSISFSEQPVKQTDQAERRKSPGMAWENVSETNVLRRASVFQRTVRSEFVRHAFGLD